jgi:nitrite reductase (NADH) small subunit
MQVMQNTSREARGEKLKWNDVCSVSDIIVGTGVAALVFGHQVAIFRPTAEGRLYALSNFDPFSQAFVMSRGILGDKRGTLKVASPIYKQNFALVSGKCLDDASVTLPVYPVRVVDGRVLDAVPAAVSTHAGGAHE